MFLPNFFILGAAKCGTTALYTALEQHPEIYMSPVKEPCFFVSDGPPPHNPCWSGDLLRRLGVWTKPEYLGPFAGVKDEKAIGEASVLYLRSKLAAERIQRNLPQSKLMAILRQPAERAYSSYWYMVQQGIETCRTFEAALAEEEKRKEEHWFPGMFHRTNGFYFQQLSVYFELFPANQIKIFLYEDWTQRPQELLKDVFHFLGVDDGFVPNLKKTNVTRCARSRGFDKLVFQTKHQIAHGKAGPLAQRSFKVLQYANENYNRIPVPPITAATYNRLTEAYTADILQLQNLIGRDLSHWLHPREAGTQNRA